MTVHSHFGIWLPFQLLDTGRRDKSMRKYFALIITHLFAAWWFSLWTKCHTNNSEELYVHRKNNWGGRESVNPECLRVNTLLGTVKNYLGRVCLHFSAQTQRTNCWNLILIVEMLYILTLWCNCENKVKEIINEF